MTQNNPQGCEGVRLRTEFQNATKFTECGNFLCGQVSSAVIPMESQDKCIYTFFLENRQTRGIHCIKISSNIGRLENQVELLK